MLLTVTAWGQKTTATQTKSSPDFWSFRPVVRPTVPKVQNTQWVRNPIDAFILQKLEAKGLTPSAEADRRTLIRRVTFDLTGLPPTPEEIEAFVSDTSPKAYEKVVDRLLASPEYGVRWGRHWLDVARYTDSLDKRDTDTIRDINDAWRYRDWVVDALNTDMPFDQFILNQVAGDLLPGPIPGDINKTGTIATGMLAVGNWGNGDGDKLKLLANIADDQIDMIGRGFLGLTLGCARCHDHKFDPISMRDYYALAGFFYSSHILPVLQPNDAMDIPLKIPLLTKTEWAERQKYDADLTTAKQQLRKVSEEPLQAFARKMLPQTTKYVLATWEFRNRPEAQAGLKLADFATAKGLEPSLLRQWRDYFQVGDYEYLKVPVRDLNGVASVHMWKTDAPLPYLVMNTNPVARKIETAEIPPGVVAVHPSAKNGVVVAWKSPITGQVLIKGGVGDGDAHGGDGIAWVLDHRTAGGPRYLASGEFGDGGGQAFNYANGAQIAVSVKRGEMIQLLVLPKENAEHDTTLMKIEIAEARGERFWHLDNDLLKDVLVKGKGNPHPDRNGEPDIWHFFDMANSHRITQSEEAESAAEAWEQAATKTGGAALKAEAERAARQFATQFAVTDDSSPFWLKDRADWRMLAENEKQKLDTAADAVETLVKNAPAPIPTANGVQEGGVPGSVYAGTQDIKLHLRGNHLNLGSIVPRGFPAVLAGEKQPPVTQGSGRLELAKWLASPSNPLTARVIINRLWQHHFGFGIVRTPSNFGFLGERPTHPELLDWLASELVRGTNDQGPTTNVSEKAGQKEPGITSAAPSSSLVVGRWSLKKMHKLMVTSATYRQVALTPVPSPAGGRGVTQALYKQPTRKRDTVSLPQKSVDKRNKAIVTPLPPAGEGKGVRATQVDPDNRLLWRMNRRRLEAEEIRDSLLKVSGKLDSKQGGPAEREFENTRRTIYLMTWRSGDGGFRFLFNGADPSASTEKRLNSTVAPQALFMLNHPFVQAQAQALAERLRTESKGEVRNGIERAYVLLYGRPASKEELAIGEAFLGRGSSGVKTTSTDAGQDAWAEYAHILLCANEFLYVD